MPILNIIKHLEFYYTFSEFLPKAIYFKLITNNSLAHLLFGFCILYQLPLNIERLFHNFDFADDFYLDKIKQLEACSV